MALNSPSISS